VEQLVRLGMMIAVAALISIGLFEFSGRVSVVESGKSVAVYLK
jgi:hypothetical protein